MKKIGIMTFHASHNIGSMLQTYAIQKIIKKRFYADVEIIDFSNQDQVDLYSLFKKNNSSKNIIKNLTVFFGYPFFKSRYNDFEKFKNQYFNLSEKKFRNEDELTSIGGDYETVICGSDQIWNFSCKDFDDAYFLPFVESNVRKVAYSPSLGGVNPALSMPDFGKYADYISKLNFISVREKNGKKWLEELTGLDFKITLDPTLLLEKEEWDLIANEVSGLGDYIFLYGVPFSSKTYPAAKKISEKIGLPVVMIDPKAWVYKLNFLRGFEIYKGSSPSDFLGLIKNSKYVITTSYHGSIFSALYRKKFWTITFKESNKDDDRIDYLLTQLGLQDRKIFMEDFEVVDFHEEIDYSTFDKNIDILKNNSFNYLQEALE